jgi:hypothetical protein
LRGTASSLNGFSAVAALLSKSFDVIYPDLRQHRMNLTVDHSERIPGLVLINATGYLEESVSAGGALSSKPVAAVTAASVEATPGEGAQLAGGRTPRDCPWYKSVRPDSWKIPSGQVGPPDPTTVLPATGRGDFDSGA